MLFTSTHTASHYTLPLLIEELGESPAMYFLTPRVFDSLTSDFSQPHALPREIPGSLPRGQVEMTDLWRPLPASSELCLSGCTLVWAPDTEAEPAGDTILCCHDLSSVTFPFVSFTITCYSEQHHMNPVAQVGHLSTRFTTNFPREGANAF